MKITNLIFVLITIIYLEYENCFQYITNNNSSLLLNITPLKKELKLKPRNLDHIIELKGDSSVIFGNSSSLNYYYVDIYIGEPLQKQTVIIDTGSPLTAVPCQPHCISCGKHINSYYDTRKSNNSKIISCKDEVCNLNSMSCDMHSRCSYQIVI